MQKKLFKKLAEKCVKDSFKKEGIDHKKVSAFLSIFKKMDVDESAFMLNNYLKGMKRKVSDQTIQVESASKLTGTQLNLIKKQLGPKYSQYPVSYSQNPSLLGGVKVKIGSYLIDNSVKSKIEQVRSVIHG